MARDALAARTVEDGLIKLIVNRAT